jgi:putative peptide zinc metalloprotease protein
MQTEIKYNKIHSTWKPCLSNNIKIVELKDAFIINQLEFGYQISVNEETMFLLKLLDGIKALDEICKIINSKYGTLVNEEILEEYLEKQFLQKGFLESNINIKIKKRPSATYLKLKIILVNKNLVSKVQAHFLDFLFDKYFFYFFGILTLTNFYLFFHFRNYSSYKISGNVFLLICLFVSHFIHEWGHVFSAKKFNISPGDIGFGFYFILPAFYVDLSDAWNTNPNNRIKINLSGIYFDYMTASICYTIFFITNHNFFLLLGVLIFIKSWYNLNPLLQSDMYWVLSDFFNLPNLTSNALNKLSSLFYKGNLSGFKNYKSILLIFYALSILFFWFFLIFHFIISSNSILLSMPKYVSEIYNMFRLNSFDLKKIVSDLIAFFILLFTVYILYVYIKQLYIFFHNAIGRKKFK